MGRRTTGGASGPVTPVVDRRRSLLAVISAYRPTDGEEQAFRLQMLDLAAAAVDPFDRESHSPGHFTASGFVLHPAGDRVLLIHHRKLGIWIQPGGHIDADDESPLDSARREVKEECGLGSLRPVGSAPFDIDIHEFPARGDEPSHHHMDLRYAFVSATAAVTPNEETVEARWVASGDFEPLGVDRSILRPVAKLL